MSVLQVRGAGFAWLANAPLFACASVAFDHGFYGLVGANGAGKSTFLGMLAGIVEPTEGAVLRGRRDLVVTLCPQVVDICSADIVALAARDDGEAQEVRGRLSLHINALNRWASLSPGERKRWQIGAALIQGPDVLLLDEPTNHLDAEARTLLLNALRRYTGVGVVVSHDRTLLDALTHTTLRIHAGTLTSWPAAFSAAKALWDRARANDERAHNDACMRARAAADALDRARRAQAAAARNINAGRRMKDKNDSDARGVSGATKAAWASAKAGRIVAKAKTELSRAQLGIPTIERDVTVGSHVFASFERPHHSVLFRVRATELRRRERVVLRDVDVTITRDDRLHLQGPNGAGKTTLLEALLASSLHRERMLYLPQEVSATQTSSAIDQLRALPPERRGAVLSIFAALGSDPANVLRTRAPHLSPGVARKLLLALALTKQVWALVLDEPTNHLDLPSIERLERALRAYPGAIVLVTHDVALARAVATRSLRLEQGTVR